MQSRVEKMRRIAVEAGEWPEELPFNVWTEEEAEKFLSFKNLTVPKKK